MNIRCQCGNRVWKSMLYKFCKYCGKPLQNTALAAYTAASDYTSQLDSSVPHLPGPGAQQHLISSTVIVPPTQVPDKLVKFQELIESHIKYHINKDRLPYRIEFQINGNFYGIDLRLRDVFSEYGINRLLGQATIGKVVPNADGNFSYSIYIWTAPSPLSPRETVLKD